MKRGAKGISLAWRFLVWFVVVALLPLASFGYLSLRQNEEALRGETLARMSRLADKKTLEIKTYLAERMQDAQLLARGRLWKRPWRIYRVPTFVIAPVRQNTTGRQGNSRETLPLILARARICCFTTCS